MAFKRIVAKSEEDLKNIIDDIMKWFKETKDYKVSFTKESRKFMDPETKKIVEKNIDVIKAVDKVNDKHASIKFIPMVEKGEMKLEIGGEGETVVAGKISNQMKGRGTLKSYSKDKKVAIKESNKIKKSELKQLIKEEIQNSLKESTTNKFEEYAEYVYSKIDEGIVSRQTRGAIIRTLQEMRNEAENIERLFKEKSSNKYNVV